MRNKRHLIYLLVIALWIAYGISLPAFCADPSTQTLSAERVFAQDSTQRAVQKDTTDMPPGLHEYVTIDFTDESRNITQGELALILINSMGIESELPTAPVAADYINLLDRNGIRPLGGWVPKKVVTNGDFAVILTRAMGLEARLISPYDIVKENRTYIQNMWEIQYRQDGYHKSLEDLFQDARFFPLGQPACPFGREYADKDKDYMIDPVSIGPDEKELYPALKYIVTLRRRGVVLEESPTKILSLRIIRAALQSPVFRSAPINVYVHSFVEEEAAEVIPITPGGP